METLQQEVFIPIKIDTKKGRKAYLSDPNDYYAITPLSKLLAKAYIMQERLRKDQHHTFGEFAELNGISQRYLRGILQLNNLSPRIKRMIMHGYLPKHLSVQQILTGKIPLLWKEQEEWFV